MGKGREDDCAPCKSLWADLTTHDSRSTPGKRFRKGLIFWFLSVIWLGGACVAIYFFRAHHNGTHVLAEVCACPGDGARRCDDSEKQCTSGDARATWILVGAGIIPIAIWTFSLLFTFTVVKFRCPSQQCRPQISPGCRCCSTMPPFECFADIFLFLRCRSKYSMVLDEQRYQQAQRDHAASVAELQARADAKPQATDAKQIEFFVIWGARRYAVEAWDDSSLGSLGDKLSDDQSLEFTLADAVLSRDRNLKEQAVTEGATLLVTADTDCTAGMDVTDRVVVPSNEELELGRVKSSPPDPDQYQCQVSQCICCTWHGVDSVHPGVRTNMHNWV